MPDIVFVRLKPYDPKRGNVRQNFRVGAAAGWDDFAFEAGRPVGINREAAEWLRPTRQRDLDDSSPLAFEIYETEALLAAALRDEHVAKLKRIRNVQPPIEEFRPPPLTVARFTDLDAPPVVHEMELRQLEAAVLKAREIEAPDLGVAADANSIDPAAAFTDMMPSDEQLMALAMDPEPEEPEVSPTPPAPLIVTTPPRKAKAPAKRKPGRPRKSRK